MEMIQNNRIGGGFPRDLEICSERQIYQLNYFICIKDFIAETNTSLKLNLFSFFICGCQHHQRKTICLNVYQTDSGVPNNIDTGSSMPISPSKSPDLVDENKKNSRNGDDSKQLYYDVIMTS
jgi:hypothetical protein